MRLLLPSFVASMMAIHATATTECRFSVNVANIAVATPAPTTIAPSNLNNTNTTNDSVTRPPGTTNSTTDSPTTTVPGATQTPTTTSSDSKTTTAVPGTSAPTTTASGTPTTTPKEPTTTAPTNSSPSPKTTETTTTAAPQRRLKDSTTAPSTSAPTTTTPTTTGNDSKTTAAPNSTNTTKTTTAPTSTTGNSTDTSSTAATYDTVDCDENFYGMWAKQGITCGGQALDVTKAVAAQSCKVYRGTITIPNSTTTKAATCFSSCYIPECTSNKWDYESDSGLGWSVYQNVTFGTWFAGESSLPSLLSTVKTSTFTPEYSCSKYSLCSCPAANVVSGGNGTSANGTKTDSDTSGKTANDVWADGTKKTNLDYAGQVTSSVSKSVTYTTIATTTTMVIASSVGVVSSSASGVAAGVSSAGSASTASATLDIAQFAVCSGALSLPGASNTLRLISTQMAFSTFTWFSFGNDGSKTSKTTRLLASDYVGPRDEKSGGMFEYTSRLGIKPTMLLYVVLAGLGSVLGGVGVILVLVLLIGSNLSCVKDKRKFQQDSVDRAIGGLVLIAVISQYALGMVCMFQICLTLKNTVGPKVTAELIVAVVTLLLLALGIIFYGLYVVRKHKEEILDIGTAAHFEKSIHKRYGTLYDQYNYDNRYFFVAKMGLALLTGMVTGSIAITGKTQLIMLIGMHVAFFLLLEVRKPHSAPFVQNASVVIVVIKVITFGLSFFLLEAADDNLPWSVQNVISYVILALQLVVLICLLARQVYIFWKTRQIKNQKDNGVADETTPQHLQMHAFDSVRGSLKHNNQQQREWTSEYYSEQNRRPQHQQQGLKEIRSNGHVTGKRYDDGHDPNEYAI
ncbi:unnamed protein product [Aphanomyces euteiches]